MGTPEEAKMFFGTESLIEIYNLLEEDTESWAGQFDGLIQFGNSTDAGRKCGKTKTKVCNKAAFYTDKALWRTGKE